MDQLLKKTFFILLISLQTISIVVAENNNLSKSEFLAIAFPNINNPQKLLSKTLWLDKSLQQNIEKILNHAYPKLRLTYWQKSSAIAEKDALSLKEEANSFQTVWVLDEIGKERPITFAISIINNQVEMIRVLTFRESRGGEIQMLAFSDQFKQTSLNDNLLLNKHIDGITGATMSVNAMKKITRLALMLHQTVATKELAL